MAKEVFPLDRKPELSLKLLLGGILLIAAAAVGFLLLFSGQGAATAEIYRDGNLVQAATRGNGVVGEAILPQARTIHTVPKSIP